MFQDTGVLHYAEKNVFVILQQFIFGNRINAIFIFY